MSCSACGADRDLAADGTAAQTLTHVTCATLQGFARRFSEAPSRTWCCTRATPGTAFRLSPRARLLRSRFPVWPLGRRRLRTDNLLDSPSPKRPDRRADLTVVGQLHSPPPAFEPTSKASRRRGRSGSW